MKTTSLPEDADALIAQAQGIATVLAEKREQLGIRIDTEALLRASIEATTCAINGYVALVPAANRAGIPMFYLSQARARCNLKIQQLRRRVMRAIAELSRLMDQKEARKAAKYVSNSP